MLNSDVDAGGDMEEKPTDKKRKKSSHFFTSGNSIDTSQVKKQRVLLDPIPSTLLVDVSDDVEEKLSFEYAASGLKLTLHGDMFQLKLLMLFVLRAIRKGYSFLLATEMDAAEKFDDIVLSYEDERGMQVYRFLQAKHRLDETMKISFTDLLNEEGGDFSLLKYFISFRKIHQNAMFAGIKTELRDFILCTNISVENTLLPYFDLIEDPDEILGMSHPAAKRMKFTSMEDDLKKKLISTLKNASELNRLAKAIADCMLHDKTLNLKEELFRSHHKVLATKVFDVSEIGASNKKTVGKLQQKFHARFSNNFLSSTDVNVGTNKLKKALVDACSKSSADTTDVKVWHTIQFERSQNFGKVFHLPKDTMIAQDKLDAFVLKFVHFICAADDGLVNIQREKGRGGGIVKENIDKLAGYILIKRKYAIKDIYHLCPEFTDRKAVLPHNLDSFRDLVLESLNSKGIKINLKEFQFHIPNFLTCEQGEHLTEAILPVDEISEEQINDFLEKLTFAVEQPNERELEEILRMELSKEFSYVDCKNVYCRFQRKMLNWMAERGGRFLSHTIAQGFFEKVRKEILGAIWFDVREPVETFTGRVNELRDLHTLVIRDDGQPTVISHATSVSGLGGIGKSELTRKYVHEFSEHFDDNIIWINAESTQTMIDSFLKLAKDHRLAIPTKDKDGHEKSIEVIQREVYEFFVRGKRRSLFVFDNAETFRASSGNAGIDRFLPLTSLPPLSIKPRFLITSRNQMWGNIKVLNLGTFTFDEALEFIRASLRIVKNSAENEHVVHLAKTLQYFPLTLQQAVAYIHQTNEEVKNISPSAEYRIYDYLQEFDEMTEELLDFTFPDFMSDPYSKTTFTTWKITFDKIKKIAQGEKVLEILNIASYFAPEQIPITLFLKLVSGNVRKLGSLVQIGKQFSMVGVEEGMMSMHRLVQQVIRIQRKYSGNDVETLKVALQLVKETLDEKTVTHAVVAWNHASDQNGLMRDFSELPVAILKKLGHCFRYEEARLFGEKTAILLKDVLGEDHRDVLEMRQALGRVLHDVAQYDAALHLYTEVLDKYRCLHGDDHKNTLFVRADIAVVLARQGKYREAIALYRDICSRWEAQLEGNHPVILKVQSDMAFIMNMNGKFDEALKIYEHVYSIRNELLGATHANTRETRHCIAVVYRDQGKFQQAIDIHKELYERSVELNGPNHPLQLSSLNEMATLLSILNKYTAAVAIHQKLVAMRTKLYGSHHPDTLSSRNNLAVTLSDLGLFKEALEIHQDVQAKKIEILGLSHPSTWSTMNNMAATLKKLGERKKALELFKQVYIMRLEHYGPDHPMTLKTHGNLALELTDAGNLEEAIQIQKDILQRQIVLLGENHPDTLTTQNNKALVLLIQKKHDEALAIYNVVLKKTINSLGPDHELTFKAQNNIGTVLMELRQYDQALELYRHVYARRQVLLAPNHLDTLLSKHNIAVVLTELENYAEALQLHQECRDTIKDVYGAQHPDVWRENYSIASVLVSQDNVPEAIELCRQLLVDAQSIFGEHHHNTIALRDELAALEEDNENTT